MYIYAANDKKKRSFKNIAQLFGPKKYVFFMGGGGGKGWDGVGEICMSLTRKYPVFRVNNCFTLLVLQLNIILTW